ncbi:hypothetical protein BJ742DRAFT_857267 [Cladochytrium replicatum]|nr:hypothetical protein BJ742DRAFT_857267 [Cladochytrium replicatum]
MLSILAFAAIVATAAFNFPSAVNAQVDGVDFLGCNTPNTLAMTFDDGPHATITPAILDVLKELGIKTTFFILGKNAVSTQAILKRAYDEGHQIAHHTYDHLSLPTLTDAQVREQIQKNEDLINSVIGHRTALMRPPYGDSDTRVYNIVKSMGYTLVKWNLDTNDWQNIDPFKIFETDLKPGTGYDSLSHDINVQQTPAKIRQIYNLVKQRGFRFISMAECVGRAPYKDGYGNVVNSAFDRSSGGGAQNPASPAAGGATRTSAAAGSAATTTGAPGPAPSSAAGGAPTTTTVVIAQQATTAVRSSTTAAPTATATGGAIVGTGASLPLVSAVSLFAAIAALVA